MPCNGSYHHMEPTAQEANKRKVAQFLLYVYDELGIEEHTGNIETQAKDLYGKGADRTDMLCKLIHEMCPDERESIVYDAHSKLARQLADWWETHLVLDKRRIKEEKEISEKEKLIKNARKKLNKKEREALGIE